MNSEPVNAYHISYKKALNPAQQQVVFFGEGPLLVIAGAGSGKTRTLTYRVARLVEDGVSPR
ncbi:MAG: UvrD-helicase domain-containing protein, partial [Desulfobacterales bacterium]